MRSSSERDLRWNFAAALVDAAGWGLGLGLVSAATFLPLFVRQLSGSTLAVGLISAGMMFGWYVPGILVARRIERLALVKPYVMALAIVERSLLLLVVPLIYLVGPRDRGALLVSFLICWFLMNLVMGCNSPAYFKLIAKTIPAGMRGRLYGIGGAVAGVLGIGAGEIAGQLITRLGYPHGYALCFGAAFLVQTVTVIPLAFMREPNGHQGIRGTRLLPHAVTSPPAHPLALLRRDPNLVRLIASHILSSASLMAAGFFTDYAIRHFAASPRTVGHFTSALMGSQVLASLLCGMLADRHGNKWVLQLATACGVGAAVVAVTAQSLFAFYPLFALSQVAATGWGIAAFNFVLELCGETRAATYTALSTLLTGPFKAGMPLLGAALIHFYGYKPVFALAAVTTGFALVVLHRIADPRHETAAHSTQRTAHSPTRAWARRLAGRLAPIPAVRCVLCAVRRERSEP